MSDKGGNPNKPIKQTIDPNEKNNEKIDDQRGALKKLKKLDEKAMADKGQLALAGAGQHGLKRNAKVSDVIESVEGQITILRGQLK